LGDGDEVNTGYLKVKTNGYRGHTTSRVWFIEPTTWRPGKHGYVDQYFPPIGSLVYFNRRLHCAVLLEGEKKGWIAPFLGDGRSVRPISAMELLAEAAE
jgi:hypothetical protein